MFIRTALIPVPAGASDTELTIPPRVESILIKNTGAEIVRLRFNGSPPAQFYPIAPTDAPLKLSVFEKTIVKLRVPGAIASELRVILTGRQHD